jgi:L-ascorbate metabolism protein UlaG (beta-lactamase superfamily)
VLRITHIGGPTTLLEAAGWRLLVDPTFDPPGKKYAFALGTSSVKQVGPALAVDDLPPIDAVLLTHEHHADNLDDAGRALLPAAGVVVTTVSGAKALGGTARGLAAWDTTLLEAPDRVPIEITATPCRHGPPLSHPVTGDVIGFALRWEGQQHGVLWISGDTVLYEGVKRVADRFDVGLAVLHLGAVRFGLTGPVKYTMSAKDGVTLMGLVQPRTVVPVHYEGWSHFSEGRAALEAELAATPDDLRQRFQFVPLGEPVDLVV